MLVFAHGTQGRQSQAVSFNLFQCAPTCLHRYLAFIVISSTFCTILGGFQIVVAWS